MAITPSPPDGSARPPVGRDNHTEILPGSGVLTWSRLLVSSRLQLWWGRDPHSTHITDRRQGGGGGSEGAGHRQDKHDYTTTHLGTSLKPDCCFQSRLCGGTVSQLSQLAASVRPDLPS